MNRKAQYIAEKQEHSILEALSKDRSNKTFNDAKDVCQHIASHVPNKSLQWVINQFIAGAVLLEDLEGLKTDLDIFYSKSQLHKLDINNLSKADFYNAVEQYASVRTKTIIKSEGTKRVFDGGLLIVELLNADAVVYYSAGTKWCTSNPETAKGYMETDTLYLIIHRESGRKFQLHYDSGQICNELDVPLNEDDILLLSAEDEWSKFIDYIYNKKYDLNYD